MERLLAYSADDLADARQKVMACLPLGVLTPHVRDHLKAAKLDLEAAIRAKQDETPTPLRPVPDPD